MNKNLIISIFLLLFCTHSCDETINKSETIQISSLHGKYEVAVTQLDNITALEWAMTIEDHKSSTYRHKVLKYFNLICEKNPELLDKVANLLVIHQKIKRTNNAKKR